MTVIHTSNAPYNSRSPELLNDLDLLIALKKEKRSCNQQPISNFVSYEVLSSGYKAFATCLLELQIPNTV